MKKMISTVELSKEVANRAGCSAADAKAMINVVFDAIKYCLFNKIAVNIPRFAKFYLVKTEAKLMVSPKGEQLWIGERVRPKLKYSKSLVDQLASMKGFNNEEE